MFKLIEFWISFGITIFLSIKPSNMTKFASQQNLLDITSHDHPYGKPERILEFSDDNRVIITNNVLNKMFQNPNVKNRKIVAFSIIGAFRKGKSFFLDYCLRYLYAHYKSINNPNNKVSSPDNWMGDKDAPLQGFSWRSGSIRDTSGIVLWNDVFLHTDERTGEKIAIIVMDTQGLFDHQTSPKDNSRIFALGTLISSIQVLNLVGVVQEDQLQYLQFATEFAKFVREDSHGKAGKPFQNLLFLVRDWANENDHEYGIEGGEGYMKQFLQINDNQKEELISVREYIYDSFEKLSCALLPYPGKVVASNKKKQKNYAGNWGEMDEEFKEELEKIIEHLLSADNLILKKINGKKLSGSEFGEYVNQYFNLFQSSEIPQAQSIYESTIEKQMNMLIQESVNRYRETLLVYENQILNVDQIPVFHNLSRHEALVTFNDAKKMGNANHAVKFKKILLDEFERIYKQWSESSANKIKELEAEREKLKKAEKEKYDMLLVQKENEKIAAEKASNRTIELEKLKAQKAIDEAQYQTEMKIADEKLKAEQERTKLIDAQYKEKEKLRKALDEKMIAIEKEKEKEREKAKRAEAEKQKLLEEQIESEKKASDRALELEKLKLQKAIDEAEYSKQKEIIDFRLKNEQERTKQLEQQSIRDAQQYNDLKREFGVMQSKVEVLNAKINSGMKATISRITLMLSSLLPCAIYFLSNKFF